MISSVDILSSSALPRPPPPAQPAADAADRKALDKAGPVPSAPVGESGRGAVIVIHGLEAQRDNGGNSGSSKSTLNELSDEEKQEVSDLKKRDTEVRRHEQAHASVGGRYAGQPSFAFEQGPDGKQYAVSGEVAIDVKPVANDPDATIAKMQIVKAAALAPGHPSGQDRAVAARAEALKLQAQAERRDAESDASDEAGTGPSPELGKALAAYRGAEPAPDRAQGLIDLVA